MKNRYYTLLVIPEKTSQVRRFLVPAWAVKGIVAGALFAVLIAGIMFLDYWFVIGQIQENRDLRVENRRMKQQIQIYQNRVSSIEETMERIRTFSTKLRVITNIEEQGELIQSLNKNLPDAASNLGPLPAFLVPDASADPRDPEVQALQSERQNLEERFAKLHRNTLILEQETQDLHELLADQRAFLGARPTRRPAVGYYTSGFGIRINPYDGREKMHEGLDIANFPGTQIRATANGVISFAAIKAGYGQTVIIDHGYGLETWYAHNSKLLVRAGQRVRRGQPIARMGSSGHSTGPHLHYEVRVNGIPVDPWSYILED